MYIEICTGKDSFRPQLGSPKRNVSVQAFTRADEEILPLFAAFQKKYKGYKDSSLIQTIPATDRFSANDAGQWFVNRHEIAAGTEILLEYRWRGQSGFTENIEYLMLVCDPHAPLWRIRLDLPHHQLSAVPCIFTEGRFQIIESDVDMGENEVAIWKAHLGVSDKYELSDILDPNQPDQQYWYLTELEGPIKQIKKAEVIKTDKGKTRIRIRRTRNIKVRD